MKLGCVSPLQNWAIRSAPLLLGLRAVPEFSYQQVINVRCEFYPDIGWMRVRQHGCQFRAAACLAHGGCGTFETMILHQFRSQCAHSCGKKIGCDSRGSKDARSEPAANGAFAKPFHSSIAETGPLDRSGGALEYPNELCDTESIIARSFLRVTGKEVN